MMGIEVPVWMTIVLIAAGYMYIVVAINHAWGARKQMREINKEMKQLQKELKDAEKRNDKAKLSELQAKQVGMMSKMSKVMFKSMVPMIIILPLVTLVFSYVNTNYNGVYFTLPVGIPILHASNVYNAGEFLIILLFVMGFVINSLFYKILEMEQFKKKVNVDEVREDD